MENLPLAFKKQILSLKTMSLRKVAINLWNESVEINFLPYWRLYKPRETCWQELVVSHLNVSKVKKKVEKLDLPNTLSKQLINTLTPIATEIYTWIFFHNYITSTLNVRIMKHLVWTTAGSIDYGKTGEKLARLETLYIGERYKLACEYCLVDYLPLLWEKLTEESRRIFTVEPTFSHEFFVKEYWSHYLAGKESKLKDIYRRVHRYGSQFSFYQFAFAISACNGSKLATEYFFSKLTDDERDITPQKTLPFIFKSDIRGHDSNRLFPDKNCSDVICYLLTLISPEKQMEILKKPCFAAKILAMLLHWPLIDDVFPGSADFIWSFISENDYLKLQPRVAIKFRSSVSDTSNSFQKFFLSSPASFRKYFARDDDPLYFYLNLLLEADDTESIKVLFRNLLAEDKRLVLCSNSFFEHLCNLVRVKEWYLIDVCLREGTVSEDERQKMKFNEIFTTFFEKIKLGGITESGFHHFLNEIDKKRSLEAEIQKTAKKMKKENVSN